MLHEAPQTAGKVVNDTADTPGLTSMLSVLLLLLAFFILLVSMVEFDEGRTQAALGSLSATFAASADTNLDAADGAFEGADGAIANFVVEIGEVLPSLLPVGSYSVVHDGTMAAILVDNRELFASGLTPAPQLGALAGRLAILLSSPPAGLRFAVEASEPFGEPGATRRAGVVVRTLERAGIAPRDLMASLVAMVPGRTRIEIHAISTRASVTSRTALPAVNQ